MIKRPEETAADADADLLPEELESTESAENLPAAAAQPESPVKAAAAAAAGDKSGSMMLVPVGNLESYIKTINQVPMLEQEDERSLARRLKDYGDLDAARKLILAHLRLVVSIARGYSGYGLPLADLIQEGNIGLMKAVRHFDPDVGGRLAAFAVHWIKAEIHDYVIKNWRVVKVATTKAQRKLFFKLRQNKKHLGWFTDSERNAVADYLGVSSADVAEMETRLAGQDIGFDADAEDDGDKGGSLLMAPSAYLEDENSNFAQHFEQNDYESWELKKLAQALETLDERSRYIIKRRWLDEDKATLQGLAAELKISIERVRQIESTALSKIKKSMLSGQDAVLAEDQPPEPAPVKRGRRPKAASAEDSSSAVPKKRGRRPKAAAGTDSTEQPVTGTGSAAAAAVQAAELGADPGSEPELKALPAMKSY